MNVKVLLFVLWGGLCCSVKVEAAMFLGNTEVPEGTYRISPRTQSLTLQTIVTDRRGLCVDHSPAVPVLVKEDEYRVFMSKVMEASPVVDPPLGDVGLEAICTAAWVQNEALLTIRAPNGQFVSSGLRAFQCPGIRLQARDVVSFEDPVLVIGGPLIILPPEGYAGPIIRITVNSNSLFSCRDREGEQHTAFYVQGTVDFRNAEVANLVTMGGDTSIFFRQQKGPSPVQ